MDFCLNHSSEIILNSDYIFDEIVQSNTLQNLPYIFWEIAKHRFFLDDSYQKFIFQSICLSKKITYPVDELVIQPIPIFHFSQHVIVPKYSILEIVHQRPVNVNALKHSEAMMIALSVLMAIMIIRTVKNAHALSMELSKYSNYYSCVVLPDLL